MRRPPRVARELGRRADEYGNVGGANERLETRAPLLDHKLIERVVTLPFALKMKGLTGKVVLKRALRSRLPRKTLDRKKIVGPRDSIEGTRQLLDVGIFAGISSGAALVGAQRCAADIDEGVVVFLAADGGWKYLSTGAWTEDIDQVTERAKRIIYF